MEVLATVAFSLGVIAYSVASTLFFLDLGRGRAAASESAPFWALGFGAACHATHIVASSFFNHVCPVESIHFALSATALVLVVTFLLVGRRRQIDALGLFVGPVALTFLVAAQFVGSERPPPPVSGVLLALHVTANLLGLGFVLLSGGASALFLFAERRLKQKRVGLGRLPALDQLDNLAHRLLLLGFPLLTFGVVTGAIFFAELGNRSGISFARAVLGYLAWGLVLAVLLLRALGGFRGRKTAYGTLLGVVFVLAVLGVYLARGSGA